MLATQQAHSAPTVTETSLPADARALSTLPRIDYEDAFVVTGVVEHGPRQWARAVIDDAPARCVRACTWGGSPSA